MMACKNVKKVLMARKKWSKFEYSQQNEENWDQEKKKKKVEREAEEFI